MIRKGLFFLRILLILALAWVWNESYRKIKIPEDTPQYSLEYMKQYAPWFSYEQSFRDQFLGITLEDEESIEIKLQIRNGRVFTEISREKRWYDFYFDGDSRILVRANPATDVQSPWFSLNYSSDCTIPWLQQSWSGVVFPLWFVVILLICHPFFLFFKGPVRRRWRSRRGLCLHCGYDLRGTTEPRCPECGKESEHIAASTEEINE